MCVCSLFCCGREVCCPLWSMGGDFLIVWVALFWLYGGKSRRLRLWEVCAVGMWCVMDFEILIVWCGGGFESR